MTRPEDASGVKDSARILVVDDDELNRILISEGIRAMAYEVLEARDGFEAIEIIRGTSFDLILLDLVMPRRDGFEVLQIMKADSELRHLPVIVISSVEEMDSIVQCIEMGAEDYLLKPPDQVLLRARIGACLEKKRMRDHEIELHKQLRQVNTALEVANSFIRETFGRYLSDEIVENILESPAGLKLGGEKRDVTVMMSDLRGFTTIGERLPPEDVVGMINIYLEIMTEVILKYHGTIDEFIGDAILVIFGAPIQRENDPLCAVACALEMQLAMDEVNRLNREIGYPELGMGIGINTGSVVVGNIGSSKRVKYGVVGKNVNLTSRIESYTKGGQILVSDSTVKACGGILRIDGTMEVTPKGISHPITIYEVGGIAGDFNVCLPGKTGG